MKNILITGSNGTFGKELIKQLKEKKHSVFTHSCNDDADIKIDFSDVKNLKKAETFIEKNKINCLINNSAIYSNKSFIEISDEEIQKIINVNLITPIILSKYFYQKNKNGLIININSLAGKYPNYNEIIYCTSKFGLTGFSSCLSINQKTSNIKVIDCHLGGMKTKMTKSRDNYERMMDPCKIAKFIINLIDNQDDFVLSSFELRNVK
jgi:short-subunit dehydrogenase